MDSKIIFLGGAGGWGEFSEFCKFCLKCITRLGRGRGSHGGEGSLADFNPSASYSGRAPSLLTNVSFSLIAVHMSSLSKGSLRPETMERPWKEATVEAWKSSKCQPSRATKCGISSGEAPSIWSFPSANFKLISQKETGET